MTLSWKLSTKPREPAIDVITVTSVGSHNQTVAIIRAKKNNITKEWIKDYYSETENSDKILEIHPDGSVILLSLWGVSQQDSGLYTVTVSYADDVIHISHTVGVFVSPGTNSSNF